MLIQLVVHLNTGRRINKIFFIAMKQNSYAARRAHIRQPKTGVPSGP
jgi:hypothetical protein